MNNTFDTVDEKVAETEFFLSKMAEVQFEFFNFRCYFSAFLSAARTTTLALQQFNQIPGFEEWYKPHREKLQDNHLAKFFLEMRNEHIHGGHNPVSGGSFSKGKATYHFSEFNQSTQLPLNENDVVQSCLDYFISLLDIVYDCYVKLGVYIDPQQFYTKENFHNKGQTIDDAELEVYGWICTSLIDDGFDEDSRWHELRSHVGECQVNHLFYSYLGKQTPQPLEPDYFDDFAYTPEEKGWIHIPAGFNSIEDYMEYIRSSKKEDQQSDNI